MREVGTALRRRLRLLHVIHDFLPRHRAGSEIYAATLCRSLQERHDVTVLCAEYEPSRQHGQVTWRVHDGIPVVELTNNWVCRTFDETYRSPLMTARLEQLLLATQPHVVHVHNLLNLSFDLPELVRARGIPVVATLHDYTLVCPSGGQRIHRADAHVCHTIDPARCVRCFRESPFQSQAASAPAARAVAGSRVVRTAYGVVRRVAPRLLQKAATVAASASAFRIVEQDIVDRQTHARRLFDRFDVVVSPSQSVADEFARLGFDTGRVRVQKYGFTPVSTTRATRTRGAKLRIAFVGTLVWHKGVHVLLDAARLLPEGSFELTIHGDLNVSPSYSDDLRKRAAGLPVTFSGGFLPQHAATAYEAMDLLVVPSIWLENAPLVIQEAFMYGVPVIGARIGGIPEFVQDGVNGRLYSAESPAELAAAIRRVVDDRAVLDSWTRALPSVTSIDDDAARWEEIYSELIERGRPRPVPQ